MKKNDGFSDVYFYTLIAIVVSIVIITADLYVGFPFEVNAFIYFCSAYLIIYFFFRINLLNNHIDNVEQKYFDTIDSLSEVMAKNEDLSEKYYKAIDEIFIKKDLLCDAGKTADAYRLNFCKMRKKAEMYKDGYNSLIDVINALIDEDVKAKMDNYKPSTGTKIEIIGYQCLHCGRIFADKARHKCNGTYRKKGLCFKEIR